MKTIYLDTEFSEGFFKPIGWLPKWFPGNKPRWSIELISIGLVDDQGKDYYAINKDYKYSRCNKWVREDVLTKLPDRLLWVDKYFDHYAPNPAYKSIDVIREDIIAFVIDHCEISQIMGVTGSLQEEQKRWFKNNQVQFKAYYADYDWVMLCTIFGTMMDLPDGFPMWCFDLKQEFDRRMDNLWWVINYKNGDNRLRYGIGDNHIDCIVKDKSEMVELLKANCDYPKQTQSQEHGALSDALWNKSLDTYMSVL